MERPETVGMRDEARPELVAERAHEPRSTPATPDPGDAFAVEWAQA